MNELWSSKRNRPVIITVFVLKSVQRLPLAESALFLLGLLKLILNEPDGRIDVAVVMTPCSFSAWKQDVGYRKHSDEVLMLGEVKSDLLEEVLFHDEQLFFQRRRKEVSKLDEPLGVLSTLLDLAELPEHDPPADLAQIGWTADDDSIGDGQIDAEATEGSEVGDKPVARLDRLELAWSRHVEDGCAASDLGEEPLLLEDLDDGGPGFFKEFLVVSLDSLVFALLSKDCIAGLFEYFLDGGHVPVEMLYVVVDPCCILSGEIWPDHVQDNLEVLVDDVGGDEDALELSEDALIGVEELLGHVQD